MSLNISSLSVVIPNSTAVDSSSNAAVPRVIAVIPANAGIQHLVPIIKTRVKNWIPAFAGMTS